MVKASCLRLRVVFREVRLSGQGKSVSNKVIAITTFSPNGNKETR